MSTAPAGPNRGDDEGRERARAARVEALRADLEAADYTVDGLHTRLGPTALAALGRDQVVPARRAAVAAGDAAAVLARLFTLGESLPAAVVDAALPRCGVDGARRLGLVAVDDGRVGARYDLRPYGDESHHWWVLSDLGEVATGIPLRDDHVLGVGGASTTLASWTPRRPVGSALDLGTGSGVQSLHLTGHAERVTVTDLSARALEVARFTADLNRQHWRFRQGSMLEPVTGEQFDLVVSNPPFVITPRGEGVPRYTYRDGGRSGDLLVADLVRAVPQVLAPGGVAVMLGNWEVPTGHDWRDVVAGWVAGNGLDAWVVQREVLDVAAYAELWIGDGGLHSGPRYERLYAAWLDDFEARRVGEIGFGVMVLQRPDSDRAPFVDLVEARGAGPAAEAGRAPMGPVVDAALAARTWLATHSGADLLAGRWRLADDVTQERHYRPGQDDPAVILLRQGGGLGLTLRLDTVGAAYASVADGELSADAAAVAIAAVLEAAADAVRAELLPVLRDAVADGFLVPA